MLLKIKETKEIEVEVEVTLPCYRRSKYGGMFWAVIDKDTCLSVNNVNGVSINYVPIECAWNHDDLIDCTEVEFMEFYYMIRNKLSNIFSKEGTLTN